MLLLVYSTLTKCPSHPLVPASDVALAMYHCMTHHCVIWIMQENVSLICMSSTNCTKKNCFSFSQMIWATQPWDRKSNILLTICIRGIEYLRNCCMIWRVTVSYWLNHLKQIKLCIWWSNTASLWILQNCQWNFRFQMFVTISNPATTIQFYML